MMNQVGVALLLLSCSMLLFKPGNALDNVITEWVQVTLELVRGATISHNHAIYHYAFVFPTIYHSLQAGGAPQELLAAFGAHQANALRFPQRQSKLDLVLKKQVTKYKKEDVEKARAIARPIAIAVVANRLPDSFTQWKDYNPQPNGTLWAYQFGPGQKFALTPQLADSTPLVWPASKLRAVFSNTDPKKGKVWAPPKTEPDLRAVIDIGAKKSKNRTQYQTDSAKFWSLGAVDGANGSAGVSGLFLDVATKVLPKTFSLNDTALYFAKVAAAYNDAYIACWQVKFRTDFWRPFTAYRTGWPGFNPIPDWESLLPFAAFQEYPSGHQCASGAGITILQKTLGTDKVTFSVTSDSAPELGPRTYNAFTQAADEGAWARVYAGVHFPSGSIDGQELGVITAEYVWDNWAKSPAAKPPTAQRR